MANLTGLSIFYHGDTVSQDSSQQAPLGTRAFEVNGNEWIYLQGTASVITGSWVRFDESFKTELVDADDVGPLAVAGTAQTASTFGFFQVRGVSTTALNDKAITADKALFLTATGGYVDDADVAGDYIEGAVSRAASSGSAFTVWLNYPIVYDDAQN